MATRPNAEDYIEIDFINDAELQKLFKARDLREFSTYAQKPEEEEIEDTSNLVDLENMDTVIQEAMEKTFKNKE